MPATRERRTPFEIRRGIAFDGIPNVRDDGPISSQAGAGLLGTIEWNALDQFRAGIVVRQLPGRKPTQTRHALETKCLQPVCV
jgi:hypothetical protein